MPLSQQLTSNYIRQVYTRICSNTVYSIHEDKAHFSSCLVSVEAASIAGALAQAVPHPTFTSSASGWSASTLRSVVQTLAALAAAAQAENADADHSASLDALVQSSAQTLDSVLAANASLLAQANCSATYAFQLSSRVCFHHLTLIHAMSLYAVYGDECFARRALFEECERGLWPWPP